MRSMPGSLGPYRILTADLTSGTLLQEVTPVSLNFTRTYNAPGTGSMDFHITHHQPEDFAVNKIAVYVLRGDFVLFGGYVQAISADGDTRRAQIGLVELSRWLYQRRVREDLTFAPGTDQNQIMASLVAYAEGDGPGIGLTPSAQASEVTRERNYYGYKRQVVGTLMEQLAGVIYGPDWEVDVRINPDGSFTRYIQIADSLTRVLDLEFTPDTAGVTSWSVSSDGSAQTNRHDAVGEGNEGSAPIATAETDPDGYPRMDSTSSHSGVVIMDTLQEHADGELTQNSLPALVPDIKFAVDPERIGATGLRVGDIARVKIDDGMAQYDDWARITQWTYRIASGSPTSVDLTMSPLMPVYGEESPFTDDRLRHQPSGAMIPRNVFEKYRRIEDRVSDLEYP